MLATRSYQTAVLSNVEAHSSTVTRSEGLAPGRPKGAFCGGRAVDSGQLAHDA